MIGIADTVLLVLMPGSGDSVQALKAGIMEIPDVIAINKMDHPAAKTMLNEVRSVLSLDPEAERRPPIVLTEAVRGEGVEGLWRALVERRDRLAAAGELEERRRRTSPARWFAVATARARARIEEASQRGGAQELLDEVQRRELDPLTAVDAVVKAVLTGGADGSPDAR